MDYTNPKIYELRSEIARLRTEANEKEAELEKLEHEEKKKNHAIDPDQLDSIVNGL